MIAKMENVIKRYGDFTALNSLDLEIAEGEILGLLGPNGAGKTTAIRVLSGLLPHDSGNVAIFGEKQTVNNLSTRQKMGLVTQEITVFTDMTAIENLRYFGKLYGLRGSQLEENVKEVLSFVGLTEHAHRKPRKYSGGMQRRLNIACALVHRPKFLIMDEPTVGIDPQSRNHILESVKKIAEAGTTVLYTSHYMEEVQAICDRITIMDAGKVIANGSLDELIGTVSQVETVRITVTIPSIALKESLETLPKVRTVKAVDNTYEITSELSSGNITRIVETASHHGEIVDFSMVKPTLEDVFLTLTGKSLRDGAEGGAS